MKTSLPTRNNGHSEQWTSRQADDTARTIIDSSKLTSTYHFYFFATFPFITRCGLSIISEQDEGFNCWGRVFLTNLFLTARITRSCDLFVQSKPCPQNYLGFIKRQSNQMTLRFFHAFNNSGLHVTHRFHQSIM